MKFSILQNLFFFIILVMAVTQTRAQIVYTDIVPDKTDTSGSYALNLNNTGPADYTFLVTPVTEYLSCPLTCLGFGNRINKTLTADPASTNEIGSLDGTSKLDANTTIDLNSLTWSTSTEIMADIDWSAGCAPSCNIAPAFSGTWAEGDTDKYLGLRLHVGAFIYYGWVRVDVVNTVSGTTSIQGITFKDYAYNSVADAPIQAGDTGVATAIHNILNASSVGAFPNPLQEVTHITFFNPQQGNVSMRIYDVSGRTIKTLTEGEMPPGNYKIDWDAKDEKGNLMAAGTYIVKIQTATYAHTEKLLIAR